MDDPFPPGGIYARLLTEIEDSLPWWHRWAAASALSPLPAMVGLILYVNHWIGVGLFGWWMGVGLVLVFATIGAFRAVNDRMYALHRRAILAMPVVRDTRGGEDR